MTAGMKRLYLSFCISIVFQSIVQLIYYGHLVQHCYDIFGKSSLNSVQITEAITLGLALLLYFILLSTITLIYLFRLKITFSNTIYEYPNHVYKIFIVVVIAHFTLSMITMIMSGFEYFESIDTIFVGISFVLYIVISLWLLYLFISRLMLLRSQFDDLDMNDTSHLIVIISKYFILVLISVKSTLLFIMTFILNIVARITIPENWIPYWIFIFYFAVEFICNCICLLLQFSFNDKYYYIFCNKIDTKLQNKLRNQKNKSNISMQVKVSSMTPETGFIK